MDSSFSAHRTRELAWAVLFVDAAAMLAAYRLALRIGPDGGLFLGAPYVAMLAGGVVLVLAANGLLIAAWRRARGVPELSSE